MYEKILVPVDGSPTSLAGLNEAITLARVMGSTIKVLHVVDEISLMTSFEAAMALPPNVFDLLKEAGQQVLQDAQARVSAAGVPVEAELFESYSGRVSELVLAKAKEWGAQIIVLGTHGRRGVGRMLLGSDAEQVLRQSPVPVLLVRGA
ncbi:nucleotide-binding universal stress UspA family protein [Acidovorax sp. 69]|uniref:universal stress protein n=1 Tax=Acidovorax sp. 69 TaxID=2035202 RepID=UPI000C24C2AA|nr:universal stress protein [Acidovorax sp. 69]PJI99284.1 nucleotide-binding universal stress UspA family protein [Acidovorax sp. 69]